MRAILAILLALLPSAALALSCVPPNAGREFNRHADEPPTVVIGTLDRDGMPGRKGHATVWVGYRLTGVQLMANGSEAPFDRQIDYRSGCIASWCGKLPAPGSEGLFLLQDRGETPPLVSTDACGGGHYDPPDDAGRRAIAACVAAGRCGAAELEMLDIRRR